MLHRISFENGGLCNELCPVGCFRRYCRRYCTKGLSVFIFYGQYLLYFLIGIALLWVLLLSVGFLILGKRVRILLRRIAQPLLIAFSTTSSEAVFPKLPKSWNALVAVTE